MLIEAGTELFFPSKILVDGHRFIRHKQVGNRSAYVSEEGLSQSIRKPIYIRPGEEVAFEEFLPYEIMVNSCPYVRRMDGYYTPKVLTPNAVEQFFDKVALEYEKYITPEFNKKVYELLTRKALRTLVHAPSKITILDYGCGAGGLLQIAAPKRPNKKVEIYGVDISREMVTLAKSRGLKNVCKCSYQETPFISHYFDIIILCFVVHYFSDIHPFQELSRLLKPGGVLAFNLHKPPQGYQEQYLQLFNEPQVRLRPPEFEIVKMSQGEKERSIHICITKKYGIETSYKATDEALVSANAF